MRVIAIGLTFTCLVTELFDKIRENVKNNVTIRLRMLSILETIASQSTFPSMRLLLRIQEHWPRLIPSNARQHHQRDETIKFYAFGESTSGCTFQVLKELLVRG